MNLKDRMTGGEAELKALLDRVGAIDAGSPASAAERAQVLAALAAKLGQMRSFIDDCLTGRSEHERTVISYKVRVEYPLYSHLDSLASLSGEFVDWSARDFSLTAAGSR